MSEVGKQYNPSGGRGHKTKELKRHRTSEHQKTEDSVKRYQTSFLDRINRILRIILRNLLSANS